MSQPQLVQAPARRRVGPPAVLALASLTVLLAGLVPVSTAALAQEEVQETSLDSGGAPTLIIDERARARVRLAFPKATFDPSLAPGDMAIAEEIEQTLRDDLENSGIFNIQGPTELSVLVLNGDVEHDFEQYRSLGNEVVLLSTLRREENRFVLEGRVYDLPSRQSILGKRYRGFDYQARRVAHSLADELHYQFTGRKSIFLTSIVYHSEREGQQELYLMDYDGRNQRQLTAHKSTSGYADWSPTGDAVAYISYYAGVPGIYYADLEDNGRKIPIYTGGTLNLSPSFAPDGRSIAFAHATDANVDIWTCPRQCETPQRITRTPSIDTNPVWSPDGTLIAFTSDRSGQPNIYVMNADGSNVRRITFDGDYNDGATWRPDSSHLAYASRRGGRFQIASTSLVDLTTTVLTDGPDSHEEPSFSPDGRHIVFTLRRGRDAQVVVMDATGRNWRQLTQEGRNMAPDWSGFTAR